MKERIPWRASLGLVCLSAWWLCGADQTATQESGRTIAAESVVELRGKLVPAPPPVTRAAFRTEAGELYTLLSNRLSSALYLDTNLQSKTLVLGGRVLPATRVFEVTRNLRSFREGKVHELFYYCDICAITSTEPGECMCCREPVRLVEEVESKLQKPN